MAASAAARYVSPALVPTTIALPLPHFFLRASACSASSSCFSSPCSSSSTFSPDLHFLRRYAMTDTACLRPIENMPPPTPVSPTTGPATKVPRIGSVDQPLRVMKLSANATLPSRGSASAAGYDLSSAYACVIPAHGKGLVKTDLAIQVPSGTYGRVAPRSGLACKHFIDTGAGVIDEDYRGNVMVLLFNHSDKDFEVKAGDRVAQLVLEKIATPDVVEVQQMEGTERGAGGFGSTGVAAQ